MDRPRRAGAGLGRTRPPRPRGSPLRAAPPAGGPAVGIASRCPRGRSHLRRLGRDRLASLERSHGDARGQGLSPAGRGGTSRDGDIGLPGASPTLRTRLSPRPHRRPRRHRRAPLRATRARREGPADPPVPDPGDGRRGADAAARHRRAELSPHGRLLRADRSRQVRPAHRRQRPRPRGTPGPPGPDVDRHPDPGIHRLLRHGTRAAAGLVAHGPLDDARGRARPRGPARREGRRTGGGARRRGPRPLRNAALHGDPHDRGNARPARGAARAGPRPRGDDRGPDRRLGKRGGAAVGDRNGEGRSAHAARADVRERRLRGRGGRRAPPEGQPRRGIRPGTSPRRGFGDHSPRTEGREVLDSGGEARPRADPRPSGRSTEARGNASRHGRGNPCTPGPRGDHGLGRPFRDGHAPERPQRPRARRPRPPPPRGRGPHRRVGRAVGARYEGRAERRVRPPRGDVRGAPRRRVRERRPVARAIRNRRKGPADRSPERRRNPHPARARRQGERAVPLDRRRPDRPRRARGPVEGRARQSDERRPRDAGPDRGVRGGRNAAAPRRRGPGDRPPGPRRPPPRPLPPRPRRARESRSRPRGAPPRLRRKPRGERLRRPRSPGGSRPRRRSTGSTSPRSPRTSRPTSPASTGGSPPALRPGGAAPARSRRRSRSTKPSSPRQAAASRPRTPGREWRGAVSRPRASRSAETTERSSPFQEAVRPTGQAST